jgi:hypothetical protein
MPTERLPLACEFSANFGVYMDVAWSAQQVPMADIIGLIDRSRYCFIQLAVQLSSRR